VFIIASHLIDCNAAAPSIGKVDVLAASFLNRFETGFCHH
jgi:hypothetical protein